LGEQHSNPRGFQPKRPEALARFEHRRGLGLRWFAVRLAGRVEKPQRSGRGALCADPTSVEEIVVCGAEENEVSGIVRATFASEQDVVDLEVARVAATRHAAATVMAVEHFTTNLGRHGLPSRSAHVGTLDHRVAAGSLGLLTLDLD
jgi:hypothetical protein